MNEQTILTDTLEETSILFGSYDANLRPVEAAFGVTVLAKDTMSAGGNAVVVRGEDAENVSRAAEVLKYALRMVKLNGTLTEQNMDYVISMVSDGKKEELGALDGDCICITTRGKPIKAKTVGQMQYVEAIKNNTVVLGVGPAGTGMTFLAVAMAVKALRAKETSRIILTRPAVEAGEKLGFLPGDLQTKIDPYLRPLYDALYEMLGPETYQKHLERGTIEIAPLAYMRGRTLDDSFIILDEAQNTTPEQMKMFLTRLGFNSKAIVTGDITQTDLPFGKKSGLAEAAKVLRDIDGIAIHHFTERDVVRHKLVQKIILAYEKYDRERARKQEQNPGAGQSHAAKYRFEKRDDR
ncbi:MAG: PhoH family protein [Clostridia bacterium]|nr:PhoH family protein [Clostridia bacterium]